MEFVGRSVRKELKGVVGTVKSYSASSGFFQVLFEDGNSEQLDSAQLSLLLLADPAPARKPKKRRRTGNSDPNYRGEDEHASSNSSPEKEQGIDLNAGFNFSLNDAADLNVGEERDCIDLNLDASGCDSVDNFDGPSLGQGTKRRGCDFDLNLEVAEEGDSEDKFKISPKFERIEESRSSGDAQGNVAEDGNVNETRKQVCIDINQEVPLNGIECAAVGEGLGNENRWSSGDMKVESSLGDLNASAVKDNGMVEDGPSEAATPVTHGHPGDSASPSIQKSSRRKRRRLPDNLMSNSTETVLRRSSRRGSARNHVSVASSAVSNPVSSSAATAVTEDVPVISGSEEADQPSVAPQKLGLPPSSQRLNLEGIPVLDLFSIYACLRSFSTILFLSPFKLEDFVRALQCNSPSLLFDSVHVSILQTLRKHLESLSNEGSESASDCLRSLNWDFLDLITWPVFMVEYFLIHCSGLKPGFDLGHFKLLKSDYYSQPASLKVEILRCLCDDLIEGEAIKSEINRRCSTSEHDMGFDRDVNFDVCKKRKASAQIAGSSSLNDENVDETPDWNSDECCLCKMEGNLICCDGCPAAYHSRCVGVVNDLLPEGDWYCPECMIDRHKPWMKLRKSLRGAELLGIDPHGRLYFKSCGYLLVSGFCDDESAFNYYHRDDLNKIIEVLRSSEFSYGGILLGIYKHWDIPTTFNGAISSKPLDQLEFSETGDAKNETHEDRKLQEKFCNLVSDVSNSVQVLRRTVIQDDSNNLADISNQSDLVRKLPEDCSLTSTCLDVRQESNGSIDLGKISSAITTRKEGTSEVDCGIDYMNYYSFGQIASSVAEELSKSSEKNKEGALNTVDEIISAQMKTIIKKSSKFSWPNIENLNIDVQKEKCGWCFSCKYPADDRDCLLIMSKLPLQDVSKTDVVGLQLKNIPKDHLNDVSCQILSIHDRLLGLLLGPWLNPHHTEYWRNSLLNACDLASVKHLLLLLVENLHHRALSADWLKHVDSVVTMGSASHVVTSLRAYSKNMNSRKRPKFSDIDSNPSSNAGSGLGMFWWRGGRLSRQVFGWKILPRSLTSKAARQGGCTKIMGILYPENSEYAKRSKYIAWRATVEMSTSAEQLALQVRELYSNIRWDDIENTHPLPTLDKESTKSIKLFRKVIVRRKCSEKGVVKYLLDFGKRRAIPDIVRKHGSVLEEPSNERKKYWLEESYLPLHLLKNFEERRIARKSSDGKSGKVLAVGRVMRPPDEKGFAYLFSKAERSEYYKCGHCHKDVLIREAVSCQLCRGFFHKRHAKKSAGAIVSECTYTCHRCQNGVSAKIDTKRGKADKKRGKVGMKRGKVETKIEKVQSQKCKNSQTDRRSLRLRSKRKALAGGRQVQLKNSKKVPVSVPLRRSPRKAKCLTLQNKKHSKRKKGKQSKSKKRTYKKPKTGTLCQKKRTQVYRSYWLNGLQLSRKPNDKRVMLFREKKLLAHCGCSSIVLGQLKCQLCCEAEYASTLDYIGCELCGEWFHGEAFGLDSENIDKLIGFRCHVCRKTEPPVCPHLVVVKTDVSQLAEAQTDGSVDCSEEVPNAVPTLSEMDQD
ncbi:DDT domain-containing protein PTM [Rosa chinensis]|uniref:DDT domain-containing protein PTM n=1 Tax=Rosa chinensis TaxID=74649 RepID=UPI000D0922F0|nr:DDT domain-containing protein PTM [Rosa chinensis]